MVNWKNTADNYGLISRIIHWLSAFTVIGLFALGVWMDELDYYHKWYQTAPDIHRSVGVLLLFATVIRLLWYRVSRKPKPITTHKRSEKVASIAVHHLMITLLFVMFISGYLITTAKGDPIYVFDWFTIPSVINGIANLEDYAGLIHASVAYTLIVLAVIHAAGALKHHLIDKDSTLKRMLGIQ